MRTFELINADGASYNLTEAGTAFFYGVDGLGYSYDDTYRQQLNRHVRTSHKLAQGSITGTVRLWGDVYSAYYAFTRFLQRGPLSLVYQSPAGRFFRRGYVTEVTKSEGNNPRACTVTFAATTPWLRELTQTSVTTEVDALTFDFTLPATFGGGTPGTVSIWSDSYADEGSPTRLIIQGPCSNPVWRLYNGGEQVATGAYEGTIQEGQRLVVDAIHYTAELQTTDGTLVQDAYPLMDYSTERFVRLLPGDNSVSVSADGGARPVITVEAELEYATV